MRLSLVLVTLCLIPGAAIAASNDNTVEWNGVSHVAWQDRRPVCPIDGESFDVLFKVYKFDITSARVRVDDGSTTWVNASWDHDSGPYAVWRATIPATAADYLYYYIELTDGSDTDYYGPNGMSSSAPASGFEIDYLNYGHAPLGSTATSDGGAAFKVWAPGISSAVVKGGWDWGTGDTMNKLGDYFAAHVPDAVPGTRDDPIANYKYVLDGSLWRTDPRARAVHPGDNYNSVNVDRFEYTWVNDSFETPAFEDMIIYQLHVGTFAGRNDPFGSTWNPSRYWDVMERVSHLSELGVTAVLLCPITEFAWDWSGGYNPASDWAVESAYGHPHEVKMMVDALHGAGIAVLLDVVWNHHGPGDDITWDFVGSQCYYDSPPVETWWGPQMDFDRIEVREYYYQAMMQWLEEYRIDGFRFDGTDFINEYQGASGWGLMQTANDVVDNRWVDKIMIAEQLPNDSWVTRPTSLGGAGFDAQYHMAWRDTIRGAIFDAASGDPSMNSIANVLYGSGQYLEKTQTVNYIELHDEAWPESGGERMVKTIDPSWPHDSEYAKGRTKLGFGLTLVSQGIPAILQGTEWLEDTEFGSGDWDNDPENRINWAMKTGYAGIFEFYKDLIAVRKSNGALRANAGIDVWHVNEGTNVIGFRRWTNEGNVILVIANFNNSDLPGYQIGVPYAGTWYELVNSQASGYDGWGTTNCGPLYTSDDNYEGYDQSLYLTVPGMSIVVLRYNDPPNDFLDADGDAYNDVCDNCPADYNPNQEDWNGDGVGDACDCNSNGVYDSVDIATGTSTDLNGNNYPDECEGILVGDVNCDGSADVFDIDAFVMAITDPAQYEINYPSCYIELGDCDGDGSTDIFDIDAFVAAITGG